MTRSGDEYVRGLRDGRTVLLNGERVADVTVHPAFAAGIRTVAQLYDLAHDPANRGLMTYPSPRDGRPINKSWLVPRRREDLVARRHAIKFWADASYGFLGRSPDHVASFFAGFAGSPAFYARGGQNSSPTTFYASLLKRLTRIYTSATSSSIPPSTAPNRRISRPSPTSTPALPPSVITGSSFAGRRCSARAL